MIQYRHKNINYLSILILLAFSPLFLQEWTSFCLSAFMFISIPEQLKLFPVCLMNRHSYFGSCEFMVLTMNVNKWNQFYFKIKATFHLLKSYSEIFYIISVPVPTYLSTWPFLRKSVPLSFSLSLFATVSFCSLLFCVGKHESLWINSMYMPFEYCYNNLYSKQ